MAVTIPPIVADVMAMDMSSRPVRGATATAKSMLNAIAGSRFSHIPFVVPHQRRDKDERGELPP